jgi:Histidine kinase-like ATPase domain
MTAATMPAHRAYAPRLTPAPPGGPPGPAGPGRDWPLRSYLELAALDSAPGCARRHVAAVLREWGLTGLRDDATLIVSELVTNALQAVRAARCPEPVRMWTLGQAGARAAFLVWDAAGPAPSPGGPAVGAEHGRGLILVEALSAQWGHYRPAGPPRGKVVWAACGATAPAGRD